MFITPHRPAPQTRVPRPTNDSPMPESQAPEDLVTLHELTPSERAEIRQPLQHEHVPGELIIKLRGPEEQLLQRYSAAKIQTFEENLVHIKVNGDLGDALEQLTLDPEVAYVAPNHVYHLQEETREPNDLKPELWGLHNTGQNGGTPGADISAREAWTETVGTRNQGPLIAVIDTGIDYNHPDLKANIWTNPNEIPNGKDDDFNGVIDDIHGYFPQGGSGDPLDGHSHGTHCAGTIAADGNNGEGVVGVNWQAELMGVKIFSDACSTTADAILKGLLYANKMGARLTSNSWGGGPPNEALEEAFASSKALHIAAAGNKGRDNDKAAHYPSNYDMPNMVAVAATDRNDRLARFSNYGAQTVDLAAPGVEIYSTEPNGQYDYKSGTSMATPHVTGAAALVLNKLPDISNEELKTRLTWSTDPVTGLAGKVASGGRLNVARALEDDTTPPAAPNDLSAEMVVTGMANVSWTSPGDDGWCGDSAAFDLRVSSLPITFENFDNLKSKGQRRAKPTGFIQNEALLFAPSGRDRTYHIGLKAMDNVGQNSDLKTTTVVVPGVPVAFEDDMESQGTTWTATGDWKRQEMPGWGKVWTDTKEGGYDKGARGRLTSQPVSLKGLKSSALHFDARFDTERWKDDARVEVSEDGGQKFKLLERFSGKAGWEHYSYDLSAYDGKEVIFRFRNYTSNPENKTDGFYFDNFVVAGIPATPQQS